MKPFRRNVALAIDGGGIKGVIVTRALSMLEDHLGRPLHELARLTAGTSTGAIIAAGLGAGLTANTMHRLYVDHGHEVFPANLRSRLWPLTRYRYSNKPLEKILREQIGQKKFGDFWSADPPTDVVITIYDLQENRVRFVKPWKATYQDWSVVKVVLASSSVPTFFPVVANRFVDGGLGSYANPAYLAAFELFFCLGWDPAETTLISLGTGRSPQHFGQKNPQRYWVWQWIEPILEAFMSSASDQQVHLVSTFFNQLDFRRFQVDLRQPISMDDPRQIPLLETYGEEMGRKILADQQDWTQFVKPSGPAT